MARLGTGGVLIEWDTYGFPGYDIDKAPGTPTTIDGRPGPHPESRPAPLRFERVP